METLAFIHTAVAYENPNPDAEITVFDNIDLKASSSLAMGLVAAGVVTATLSHTDQAQAAIYYGQRGSGVAALQSALHVYTDGVFGPQTLSALKRFQANRGLAIDGIAGPATLPALGLSSNRGPDNTGTVDVPVADRTYVTASSLIVRNAPAGYSIGSLGYGARALLTGATRYAGGRSWSQLASGGWVASGYLSSGGGSDTPVPTRTYAAAGSGLLIRNAPAGYVTGSLGYGSSINLTGATRYAGGRTWSQLSNGGWVASDYIGYR